MISRYAWYLREFLKKVWVRVVGFAIFALLAALLARSLSPYLPPALALQTGSEAVSQLLGILTSSMLAVTTFSLSIAVAAFAAAAGSATPRATVLLQQDRTTQNVLATFLGAFLFGLVGLVALHAEFYDESGMVAVSISPPPASTMSRLIRASARAPPMPPALARSSAMIATFKAVQSASARAGKSVVVVGRR